MSGEDSTKAAVVRVATATLALPVALVGLHTVVRIVRHFVKFPVPELLADLIDNPLRRRVQPPALLAERHGVRTGMTVLDVGPGNGRYTLAAARAVGPSGRVHAIDLEPRMIDRVSQRAASEGVTNIEGQVADVYALPYPDDSFDVVYLITVTGEIPEPVRMLRECRRVLKPAGTLGISELLIDPDYPLRRTVTAWATAAGFQPSGRCGTFFSSNGGHAWTPAHERWLRGIRFDQYGTQAAFDTCYEDVIFTAARRAQLDRQIEAMAADSEFTPIVNRLCCLRGIATLTGFGLAVEVADWTRFDGNNIGAFLGLAPGEASTGDRRVLTSITKAGNTHARRLLVEAAWHHKPSYRTGNVMLSRWNKAPGPVVAKAHQGKKRLHERWLDFDARHRRPVIANTAIARELAGWCWTLATM